MTTDPTITIAGLETRIGVLSEALHDANRGRADTATAASKLDARLAATESERDALAAQLAEARAALDAAPKVCAIDDAVRAAALAQVERDDAIAKVDAADQRTRSLDAAPTAERETSRGLVAQVDTWRDTWARVETIVDEAFGPFPVLTVYDTICAMERGIHDGIRAAQELAAIRDLVAPGNPQGTVVDAVRALRAARDAAIARAEKAEADLRKAVDAPRLAARKTPTVVASHGAVDLVRTASGEWGVRWRLEDVDDGATDTAWHLTEADARADFRDDTGTVSCESCARFIEHDDAHVDADGIYTCADETACSAAIRAKESAK